MSWGRVGHPSDIVKPGQKIDIMVLKYDPDQEKISLGLKQILPDPWQHIDQFYQVGDEVDGQITRLVPFGAFVALDHGIEGIIPLSEMAERRIAKPEEIVSANQKVRVKIVNIRPGERRMILSLRQAEQFEEGEMEEGYTPRRAAAGTMTIGEMLGDVFTEQVDDEEYADVDDLDETIEVAEDADVAEVEDTVEDVAAESADQVADEDEQA